MDNILKHAHSGIMWLFVLLLLITITAALTGLITRKETSFALVISKITKYLSYLQVLLGIGLLFVSPMVHYGSGMMRNAELRFYGMEHPLMMLIAVGLMSIGMAKARRKAFPASNRMILIFYSIAAVIIAAMIPWSAVLK